MRWPFSKPAALPVATDTKSLPAGVGSGDPELYELFTGLPAGGFGVSATEALTVPAVQAAVRAISEAAATLPITIKRRVGDLEENADLPQLALLTGQANPWTSGFELIRDLVGMALCWDQGGLAWVNRVRGEAREIIRYDPGSIQVEYASSGTGEPTYTINGKKLRSQDVIHVRGAFDKCPLTLASDAIGAAKAMETYAGNLFTNGARPGGVITIPGKIGDDALTKMRKAWRSAFEGGANSGKTAILWEGGQFNAMSLKSTDAEFLANRKFQLDEIARAFRVPPSMVYSLDRMTWSNWESAGREFITYTLMPWLRALESAFNRALLNDEELREFRFAFDVDDTTQADLTDRAAAVTSLVTTRILNPNEARDWLGMPPRPGGEEYSNPAIEPSAPVAANSNKPNKEAA